MKQLSSKLPGAVMTPQGHSSQPPGKLEILMPGPEGPLVTVHRLYNQCTAMTLNTSKVQPLYCGQMYHVNGVIC